MAAVKAFLQVRVEAIESEVDHLVDRNTATDDFALIAENDSIIIALTREKDVLIDLIRDVEKLETKCEQQLETKCEQLEVARAQLDKAAQIVATLDAENARLREELSASREELSTMRSKLEIAISDPLLLRPRSDEAAPAGSPDVQVVSPPPPFW